MKKTSKKVVKKQTKSKKITKSAQKVIAKPSIIEKIENVVIEQPQTTTATTEKLPFDIVDEAFNFFSYAFQPDGFEDDEGNYIVDDRFVAMWKSFLLISGWQEDEFWGYSHDHNHECPDCKKEREEQEKLEKSKNTN